MSPHEVNMWRHHSEDVVEGDVARQPHRRCTVYTAATNNLYKHIHTPVCVCG